MRCYKAQLGESVTNGYNAPMDKQLLKQLRQHDYERFVCALMEPAAAQPRLFALLLLNQELARAGQEVSDWVIAAIRLKWWHEAVQNGDTRSHPLLSLLAENGIDAPQVEALIAPRLLESQQRKGFANSAQFDDYLQQGAGQLHAMLSVNDDENIKRAGVFYGLVGVLRSLPFQLERGIVPLPLDVLRQYSISPAAIEAGLEREAFGHLMQHYLQRLEREAEALRPQMPTLPKLVRRLHVAALLYVKALRRCGGNPAHLPRRLPNLPLRLWIGR